MKPNAILKNMTYEQFRESYGAKLAKFCSEHAPISRHTPISQAGRDSLALAEELEELSDTYPAHAERYENELIKAEFGTLARA